MAPRRVRGAKPSKRRTPGPRKQASVGASAKMGRAAAAEPRPGRHHIRRRTPRGYPGRPSGARQGTAAVQRARGWATRGAPGAIEMAALGPNVTTLAQGLSMTGLDFATSENFSDSARQFSLRTPGHPKAAYEVVPLLRPCTRVTPRRHQCKQSVESSSVVVQNGCFFITIFRSVILFWLHSRAPPWC